VKTGVWTILVGAAVAAALVAGCSRQHARDRTGGKAITILCSTFPMYLFTRQVTAGRDAVQVEAMLPAATGCPHDYTLTPQDMQKIAAADVFIANGLGMEEFLGEPLKRANSKIVVVDTSAGIGGLIQLRGEEGDAQESRRHTGMNPHLFASPRMAERIVRNIASGLGKVDPGGAELYRRNADAYARQLDTLAGEFTSALRGAANRKIVTEHAVFDYLARDCGLEIVAVVEENPGQAPSASQMRALVETVKDSGAAAVFTEPQYPAKVSQTIAREVGIPVAVLDPVASGPDDAPMNYYERTMRANLDTLVATLSRRAK
jgi:zinc transport system substrate-binding protein